MQNLQPEIRNEFLPEKWMVLPEKVLPETIHFVNRKFFPVGYDFCRKLKFSTGISGIPVAYFGP